MSLETTAPTAGTEAGTSDPEVPTPVATAPVAPAERTFTQAEVDRIAESERKRAQRLYERQLQDQQRPAAAPVENVDPTIREIGSLKQQMTGFALDKAIDIVGKRYPDFAPNMRDILELVMDKGLDRAAHMSIEDILDTAYRYWSHDQLFAKANAPQPDLDKIRKEAADKAIKEYTDTKVRKSEAAPRPLGASGATPAGTDPRAVLRTKKGAFDAALELVNASKAASS